MTKESTVLQMEVQLTGEAYQQFSQLPLRIQQRVRTVFKRLDNWPDVSGVKWLRGAWKNHAHVRTGDYRAVLHVEGSTVVIDRLAHRTDAYAE